METSETYRAQKEKWENTKVKMQDFLSAQAAARAHETNIAQAETGEAQAELIQAVQRDREVPASRSCVKIYRGNTNLTLSELNAWEIANLKSENKNAATILSKLTVDTDYRLLMLEFGSQTQI